MSGNVSESRRIGGQRKAVLYWLYPLITLGVCAIFIVMRACGITPPQQSLFLLLAVLLSNVYGGLIPGLVSAVLGSLTMVYTYSKAGTFLQYEPVDLHRAWLGAAMFVICAVFVGRLKNKLVRVEVRLVEQRLDDFSKLFSSLDVPIVECNWQRILSVNDSFCKLTGFAREELINQKPPYPFWPSDDHARTARALEAAMRGQAHEFEMPLVRKDGSRIPVIMYVSQLKDDQGRVNRLVYSYHNISAFKRTEESLREHENVITQAIYTAGMAVVVIDPVNDLAQIKGCFEELHGLVPGSFSGHISEINPLIHPDDLVVIKESLQRARDECVNFDLQYRVTMPQGQWRLLRAAGRYQYDDSGKPLRILILVHDVTALRQDGILATYGKTVA